MLLDALHAVTVLPPGGAEVLLQGPSHRGKYGQSGLAHVHNVRRRCTLVFFLHAAHVCEGLLNSNDQPGREITHSRWRYTVALTDQYAAC